MNVKDISGQRFGRLTAVTRDGSYWLCKCDCGEYKRVYRGNLKQGNTASCGCFRREACSQRELKKSLARGYNRALNTKFNYYKRNAKLRGIIWCLTRPDFEEILKEPCHYCGSIEKIGLDRADSSKGYDYSNVLACCTSCNQAKNNRSISEFAAWVRSVYTHLQTQKWGI